MTAAPCQEQSCCDHPGLGDAAVREDAGGVTLVKGDSLLSLFVIAMGGEEERITRDLVETALPRLP